MAGIGQPFATVVLDNESGETTATTGSPRWQAMAAGLADGRVLVAGGERVIGSGPGTQLSAETYGRCSRTPGHRCRRCREARAGGAAVMLSDGSALLVGGYDDSSDPNQSRTDLASAIRLVTSP